MAYVLPLHFISSLLWWPKVQLFCCEDRLLLWSPCNCLSSLSSLSQDVPLVVFYNYLFHSLTICQEERQVSFTWNSTNPNQMLKEYLGFNKTLRALLNSHQKNSIHAWLCSPNTTLVSKSHVLVLHLFLLLGSSFLCLQNQYGWLLLPEASAKPYISKRLMHYISLLYSTSLKPIDVR